MLESNIEAINNDIRLLIKDAQALFYAAKELTGDKADELRNRGMRLLDTALLKIQESKAEMLVSGKAMTASADRFVKDNPWRAVASATGLALVLGLVIGRK